MLRLAARLALIAVVLCITVLVSFRLGAVMREEHSQSDAAGPGALFASVEGLELHYRSWGPADGPPLLFVPGTLAWSETFHDIAAPLAEQGLRVIAVDLPPFGYSQRPTGHDYSRAAQARRILGFADALKLERFALGVHSYGGGAAIEAAFAAPDRIESLVLLDVALGLGKPHKGPPLAPLLAFGPIRDTIVSATFSNPLVTPIGLRDFIHDDALVTPERTEIYTRPLGVAGTTPAIAAWLLSGLFADETGSKAADPANYRAFDRPLLVIWGAQDSVTPLAQGKQIAALFPRSDFAVLDGVNHIPHVEKPGEVVRLIGDFLDRVRREDAPPVTPLDPTSVSLPLRGSQ